MVISTVCEEEAERKGPHVLVAFRALRLHGNYMHTASSATISIVELVSVWI